jgi:transposase
MTLQVRRATEEERAKIERLTRAHSAPVRLAARARLLQLAATGLTVPVMAAHLGISETCARLWMTRFNHAGLDGLDDAPRAGRSPTYREDARSQVIAKARSLPPKPTEGEGPPTGHWTLDRLQEELAKAGLPIKRSQIRRRWRAEHSKWQKPRTWLASDDPEFAEKRALWSGSTRRLLRAAP